MLTITVLLVAYHLGMQCKCALGFEFCCASNLYIIHYIYTLSVTLVSLYVCMIFRPFRWITTWRLSSFCFR